MPGFVGQHSPEVWMAAAKGEEIVDCHMRSPHQCAGAAIFRANICKRSRDPGALTLPADRNTVFAFPADFLTHHNKFGFNSSTITDESK
jgi:hypothetical protein